MVEARLSALRPAVRACYEQANVRDGVRWVRVALESNAALEDIFSLIRLKAELTGMENI